MNYERPSISRRYISSAIDGIFIIFTFVVISYCFRSDSPSASSIRIATLLGMLFLYEPLLTSYSCTIGQKLMGIRVRKVNDMERRISIIAAYSRYFVKIFLGIISLFSIVFTKERRAIHDFASGSIMIKV